MSRKTHNVPADGKPWFYCYSHRSRWFLYNFSNPYAHAIAGMRMKPCTKTNVSMRPFEGAACVNPPVFSACN